MSLARPLWVNVLILAPLGLAAFWHKRGLRIGASRLFFLAIFAIAFGVAESAVVVYLRASANLLPGYLGTLADVRRMAPSYPYSQVRALGGIPSSLLHVESYRELCTMVMLGAVALLSADAWLERFACFLWAFAIWDLTYYAGLRLLVGWPRSFRDFDVLFLIPTPWIGQVWFPVLVSALTVAAVLSLVCRGAAARD